jgi:hypothetical protein
LKKTISIEQFEKSISYVSAGDKTSTNPKFLYFDKPLHLSFANLDVKGCLSYYKQKAIFKFEIC